MFCGIDVSKGKSNVCILGQDKKVKSEFEIKHDKQGFEKLEKHLTKETIIGMETTGNYCKIIYRYLKERYENVNYVDNLQMKNFASVYSPTIKNDRVDARLIAAFLSQDFKRVNPLKVDELKDLSKLYQKTLKQMTRYKYMFKDQINIIFPELDKLIGMGYIKGISYLLLKHPSPEEIAKLSVEEIKKAFTENL
ncbi:MAG: IS110 family transposase, partial [Candidatus Coatesbacteria bacterium]|nr:IS110 family transposase [Candidatus Coatesbacteria bacterium]